MLLFISRLVQWFIFTISRILGQIIRSCFINEIKGNMKDVGKKGRNMKIVGNIWMRKI